MVVALHASVHDDFIALLSNSFPGHVDIDPVGVAPHAWIYLSELHRGARVIHYRISKIGVEISVIEKNIGIVEPSVEVPFE